MQTVQHRQQHSVTEGKIWQELLVFFFPLLLGTLFQQLYNTADAIIVGRFVGKEALASVGGSSAVLVNLFVNFFTGLSSGATVVISQFYGAKRMREVSEAIHTAVCIALIGGLLFALVGYLVAPSAIAVLGTPPDIADGSVLYLRIFFCGMIPNLLYNMGAAVLRAVGDSRRPFLVLVASCAVNILLDLLLVVALGLGVRGVAFATILSQLISAILVIVFLCHEEEAVRLRFRQLRPHAPMARRILQIGLPAGVQTSMYSVSNLLIQAAINALGTDTVSAWAAYGKIDVIYWMVLGSFSVSVTTFVGQNFGAARMDRVYKSIHVGLIYSYASAGLIVGIFELLGWRLLTMFTTDPSVLSIGQAIIRQLVPFFFVYVLVDIITGALRGLGDSILPMILTLCGVCLMRVIWILFVVPAHHTLSMVLWSYPLTWTLTAVLFVIYFPIFLRRRGIRREGT